MKIAGIIAIAVGGILLIGLIVLARYGLFSPVEVSEQSVGPYTLVFTKHVGDYKNVAPVMDELYHDLRDNFGIETTKGFGLYYDNPREVSSENLRSIVGCIVEGKTPDELTEISEKYGVVEYPFSRSIVAEFPMRGSMSVMMGVFKVYPKLNKYMEEQGYTMTPVMELYDQPNKKIAYITSPEISEETYEAFLD